MELELRLALPGSNPSTSHLDAGDHDQRTTLPLFVDDNNGGGGGVVGGGGELGDGWLKSNVDDDGGGCGGRRRSGRCVKVKMDGVGIGRKVDVSLHHSYQALFHTLKRMFPIDHHDEYVITYENERGDWMVVGDVPWEAFIKSVKQLKILT